MNRDDSTIEHHPGGTTFAGRDAVSVFRAYTLATSLSMYAKTGLRPTRHVGPRDMMRLATEITGRKFKARDYEGAAAAVKEWASLMRSGIPEANARRPSARYGWVRYPQRPGAFHESLPRIAALIGASNYEHCEHNGEHYVRRIQE